MENCSSTSIIGNNTICYVETGGGGGSSFRHDVFVAIWAIVGTCAAIAAYNYYIEYKARIMKRNARKKREEKEGEEEETMIGGLIKNYGALAPTSNNNKNNSKSNRKRKSELLAHAEGGTMATGNFLSGVLSHMWNHANVAVSNAIKEALEPTLKDLVGPLSLHFVRLDLGHVPIRTTNMYIHRVDREFVDVVTGDAASRTVVQIDCDVEWDGECDVMLQASLSKSAKISFGVEKIKLFGRMQILLGPLTTELPIVSAVQAGFTNPPDLQLSFSGAVSGLNKLGAVRSALPAAIQSALAGVLVLPQRLTVPVDMATYDFLDTCHPPVGVVRISAVEGRGFQVQRKLLLRDIPDVYCKISLGASETFRTSTKVDNLTPSWEDESSDFVLYDMDQKIYLQVFDEDKTAVDSDDALGKAAISVRDIFKGGGTAELELELDGEKNRCYITLSAEMFDLTDRLRGLSSTSSGGENELSGLATIIVTKACDIPIPKEDAATHVKVVYGEGSDHEKVFYTGTVMDYPGYDALNPMYDCVFHVPITAAMMADDGSKKNRDKNDITLTLIDGDGGNGHKVHGELGKIVVTHEALRNIYKHTMTRTSPIGNHGAKLEYMISLRGVQSEEEAVQDDGTPRAENATKRQESLYGGTGARADIRVTVVRGRGFPVRSRSLAKDDVPDVYCKIRLKEIFTNAPWRTKTIKDTTMPQWNECKDFTNVLLANAIFVEVFDENRTKKDGFYGSAELSVEQLLRKRTMEVQLKAGSALTEMRITLRGIDLGTFGKRQSDQGVNAIGPNEEVLIHYHPHIGDEGYESTLLEEQAPATPQKTVAPKPAVQSSHGKSGASKEIDVQEQAPIAPQKTATSKPATQSSHGKSGASKEMDLRVTALRGRGFQVRKRRIGKDDIPDIYLKIRMSPSGNEGSSSRWKTATIKNSTTPRWDESKEFEKVDPAAATVIVGAYDHNKTLDDFLGSASFSVEQLLQEDVVELELRHKSALTETYVTLRCTELISSGNK